MGWSCTKSASNTMRAWEDACRKNSGSQNAWRENGQEYFFEHDRVEHSDGAITGSIYRVIGEHCCDIGSFRINGDGSIARAPAFLKKER